MQHKRGLSPVIAVVMLLLITIVAAGIILTVVVPFVSNNLDESKECFEILGDVSIAETPYNCVNATDTDGRTGFSVRIDNENIVGFRVALQAQGSSDAQDITDGTTLPSIRMLTSDFNTPLEVPQKGGVRTYVANGTFNTAELFPILASGGKCDKADEITFVQCEDQTVMADITQF